MIDPVAAIIALLSADSDLRALVGERIAEKHKYALPESDLERWPNPSKALTLHEAGSSDVDLDTPRQLTRLEARGYGEDAYEAKRVVRMLIEMTRRYERAVIGTGDGNALIYFLLANGSPQVGFDPELELDVVVIPLRAAVAEDAVP